MSTILSNKNELKAFKARLVQDVFGKENNGNIEAVKVMMLIWLYRKDEKVVKFMAQFLAFYAGSRQVFKEIEFYLPQLAHMIIHLQVDDDTLDHFALVIAQQSLHCALQLNWILQGAIEDYQPELHTGKCNPGYNPLYYLRCIKLLSNLERCVVYGRPPRSMEVQRLYEEGKIDKKEHELLEKADRRRNAIQFVAKCDRDGAEKKNHRTRRFSQKRWKKRFFIIENRCLNCYHSRGGELLRSMPLEGATIEDVKNPKYPHMFSVRNHNVHFAMRAKDESEKKSWMKELKEKSQAHDLYVLDEDATSVKEAHFKIVEDLTGSQLARYELFKNERNFVQNVGDIAEELRFVEPKERNELATRMMENLEIPPCVYSPLCNSTDTWCRVQKPVCKDVKVFNTKARCPIIMYFVSRRGEQMKHHRGGMVDVNLDVAEYMHLNFDTRENMEEDMEEANTDEEDSGRHGGPWHDSLEAHVDAGHSTISRDETTKGNQLLQNFLRDTLATFPQKLAIHLESSNIDMLPSESVPILETMEDEDEDENITSESIDRAKEIICHGENWAEKSARMLRENEGDEQDGVAEIVGFMAKSNDDLRQEVFVMQMIHYFKSVFAKAGLPLYLKTYKILSTSKDTGLIEVLTDCISLDALKKSEGYPGSLLAYYVQTYGEDFNAAQENCMQSLAAYSVVSYLLRLKDRHNGNIMIDTHGHLIHIDFGFAMGMAPGHKLSMERAPFKLTSEYVDVMGGPNSECFSRFKQLIVAGIKAARINKEIALGLVDITMYKSNYPCFSGSRYGNGVSLERFKERLMLDIPDDEVETKVLQLIEESLDHYGTHAYDKFQQLTNGYAI